MIVYLWRSLVTINLPSLCDWLIFSMHLTQFLLEIRRGRTCYIIIIKFRVTVGNIYCSRANIFFEYLMLIKPDMKKKIQIERFQTWYLHRKKVANNRSNQILASMTHTLIERVQTKQFYDKSVDKCKFLCVCGQVVSIKQILSLRTLLTFCAVG